MSTEIFSHLNEVLSRVNDLEMRCQIAETQLETRIKTTTDISRFYAVAMTSDEVAKFHGVSRGRVCDYADRGLIELHPNSTDAKRLFRASTALTLNFDELRKRKLELKR